MTIIDYKKEHFEEWADMANLLFNDFTKDFIESKLKKLETSPKHQTFLAKEGDQILGYATASIRTDYVEGSTSSPVGYLEMIFVKEAQRKSGVAKELYQRVENWSSEKGCSQVGSDTWEWNNASRDFHKQLGFREEDILVHFIKEIQPKEL